MGNIIKVLGPEISIASANTVANSALIRIVNTGAQAVMDIQHANGTVRANVTVSNTESLIVTKLSTERVVGANMRAAPVAIRG